MSFLQGLFVLFGGKKFPDERQRMMDRLEVTRLRIWKRVQENLPEQLRNRDEINRAIAEQINYATAGSQFVGSDEEMLNKLEALVAELRANEAEQAISELILTMKMRSYYLGLAKRVMR